MVVNPCLATQHVCLRFEGVEEWNTILAESDEFLIEKEVINNPYLPGRAVIGVQLLSWFSLNSSLALCVIHWHTKRVEYLNAIFKPALLPALGNGSTHC